MVDNNKKFMYNHKYCLTGVPKMAKRPAKYSDEYFVKALDPKDADTKYMGEEPFFPLQPENRILALTRSFTWYNRFYGKKEAKELLVNYLDFNKKTDIAKQLRKVPDSEFIMTYCWLARMNLRGLTLLENEQEILDNEIARLQRVVVKSDIVVEEVVETVAKPNIQDYMREKARDAAGELEGLFDTFLADGAKSTHNLKIMDEVAKKNVSPQHISIVSDVWKKKLPEFEQVLEGKDGDLVIAYKHLSKTQIKNIIKFIEQVLNDLNSYVSVKKASKAPRKKKTVPVEKIVAKLKYLKEFKDPVNKLELTSIHPTKLHGASECWLYDTAKRKLHHLIADEYSKTFTVKGNTILGFDKVTSEIKTLRKPGEQLKEIMGSKPAARKYFKDIKSIAVVPNGRFNESIIILKAW